MGDRRKLYYSTKLIEFEENFVSYVHNTYILCDQKLYIINNNNEHLHIYTFQTNSSLNFDFDLQEDKTIATKSTTFHMKNIVQIRMIQLWPFHVSIYKIKQITLISFN